LLQRQEKEPAWTPGVPLALGIEFSFHIICIGWTAADKLEELIEPDRKDGDQRPKLTHRVLWHFKQRRKNIFLLV
jgi:hypothetical protein